MQSALYYPNQICLFSLLLFDDCYRRHVTSHVQIQPRVELSGEYGKCKQYQNVKRFVEIGNVKA